MKQTAVEWLVSNISSKIDKEYWCSQKEITEFVEQAKAMEKEQIVDAFVECWKENMPDGYECKQSAEYYYNENYGGNKIVDTNEMVCELPNVDYIPKKETLEEAAEIDLTNLCYYDKRNPDCSVDDEDIEDHKKSLLKKNKTCSCDNCFYGRTELAEQLIWQSKRMYSEEEMLQALNIGFTSTDETWEECVEFAKEQFKKGGQDA